MASTSTPRCTGWRWTSRSTRKAWPAGWTAHHALEIASGNRYKERRMGTPSFALHDRIAVVTGAAQGIGAACARRLARDGAAVALWDVNLAPAQALADELRAAGAKTCAQRCDVSRKAEVDAALAATEQALGRVNA